jgi:hypothetical protein
MNINKKNTVFGQTKHVSVTVIHCVMCKGKVQDDGNFFVLHLSS